MTVGTTPERTLDQQHAHWLRTCVLFFLGWVFMYADRSILSPVQEDVRNHFDLSNAQVGLVSSVFFIVYVLMQVPSGVLGDRVGRVRLIFVGFCIFAVATALTGVVGLGTSFGLLLLARALAGFGEGLYYGPQFAKSGETTPTRYRALGVAIINSGQGVGTALGLVASGFITYSLGWGWQATFILFGVPTFLVGLAILLLVPDGKRRVKVDEGVAPPTAEQGPTTGAALSSMLRNRSLAATFFMLFCSVYGFFVMVTWLPTYLVQAWDVDRANAGWIASIVFWVAIPAGLLSGHLSDRLRRRREFVFLLVPLAILAILLLATASTWTLVIAALVLYGLFGKLVLDPVLVAIVADRVPNARRSTAYGLYNGIGMSAAIVSPYVTGAVLDGAGGYRVAFGLAMALLAIGGLVFAALFASTSPAELED